MEIRIVLDDDGPGPASNGDAAVVTSLKTKPEDGEGSGKEDPEQTKLRAGLNLSVKFPQFFTVSCYTLSQPSSFFVKALIFCTISCLVGLQVSCNFMWCSTTTRLLCCSVPLLLSLPQTFYRTVFE
ncbi:uncharacterized protein LOC112173868 isoform X2 [Rosa chinensis]|uniref:uncharacterized protein LOC112173868 isoform X2 n=1 Tax=Rosa chinensis TaxID=74649 RepID=UPI000D08F8A5|nr:uncharacterized protein LOC112173868 isoform X2 [Rosa chinensis]